MFMLFIFCVCVLKGFAFYYGLTVCPVCPRGDLISETISGKHFSLNEANYFVVLEISCKTTAESVNNSVVYICKSLVCHPLTQNAKTLFWWYLFFSLPETHRAQSQGLLWSLASLLSGNSRSYESTMDPGPGSAFELPPSSNSCPFPNIQTSALLENLLLSQPEAWVYNTDVPMFQNPGTATCLQDLQPSLTNYALSESQFTGPDQPIPLTSNFLPHETVQPTSTPMTSLIPPATLLVPYPVLVPLPVPLPIPIPIPIQIHQSLDSKAFIKTSRTGYMIDKSMQTSPTISCCTSSMAYPIFPHTPTESQDLSLKATQTKREHLLSASPNSPLDLSLVSSNGRCWHDDMNGQNTQYKGAIHEGNGNNITVSKYEDYNGRIVHSTQTVKVFASPTETILAPFCYKRRGFSQDYMINIPMKPDRSQDTGPQDSSSRSSRAHPLCSELQRSVRFKRDGSQKMYGKTYKKQNLAFLPRK